MDTFRGEDAVPSTLHPYLYGGADPTDHVDPSGQFFGGIAEVGIANSIASTLNTLNGNQGLAYMQQLKEGGVSGFSDYALATFLPIAGLVLAKGGAGATKYALSKLRGLFGEAKVANNLLATGAGILEVGYRYPLAAGGAGEMDIIATNGFHEVKNWRWWRLPDFVVDKVIERFVAQAARHLQFVQANAREFGLAEDAKVYFHLSEYAPEKMITALKNAGVVVEIF